MQQRSANNKKMIDVSERNGSIVWSQVAASGVWGSFIKFLEGATYHDSQAVSNYTGAKAAGVHRSPYLFARPATSSATDEANSFVDAVLAAGGFDDLDPMLDFEDAGGKSPQELADFILTVENIIKTRTGREIILYTYAAFIEEHLAPVVSQINHLRLYLADYSGYVPNVPGWDKFTVLQYTDRGSVPGISGNVDLDAYDDTVAPLTSQPNMGGITLTVDQIKQLQTNLKAVLKLPSSFAIDGVYGPATTAAVKSFQYMNKLVVDGIAGPQTIGALNKAVAALNAPKTTSRPSSMPNADRPVAVPPAPPVAPNGGVSAPVATVPSQTTAPSVDRGKLADAVSLLQQGIDELKTL